MANENKNVIIEIVDIDTGEILVHSRKLSPFWSYGFPHFDAFLRQFYAFLRSGRNCTFNCTAFDERYNLSDAEDIFINNKQIKDIF